MTDGASTADAAGASEEPTSFEALIAPVGGDRFFADYFERRVLHVPRNDPARFATLAASIDVDQIIHLSCPSWGDVSLAKAGVAPDECPHVRQPPGLEVVRRAYDDGYTIVINDLQRRNLAVARLCRIVENRFFCRANVNLYLTGGGCAGLNRHYDDDDVIVIQLRGQKSWRTYSHRDRLPLGDGEYRFEPDDEVGEEAIMNPGDVLYIPRGTPHEAAAQASESLHITLSLNLLRWADLVHELVTTLAEDEPWLRRAVPPDVLRTGAPWPADRLLAAVAQALERRGDATGAIVRAQERLIASAQHVPAARPAMIATGDPTGTTRLTVAPDQLWGMTVDAAGAVVRAIDTRLDFPDELAPIADLFVRRRTFTIDDMPHAIPYEKRLAIVRQLIDHAFLTRADREDPPHEPVPDDIDRNRHAAPADIDVSMR